MFAQDVDQNEVDEVIEKIAKKIVEMKMETPAILSLEAIRPLSFISSQMGRILIAPWFGIFGFDAMGKADRYMTIFEDRKNIKKLIKKIEELANISDRSK